MPVIEPVEEFKRQFQEHLQKFTTAPYLFMGSGISRRYLNIPTWLELLRKVVEVLGLDKPFEYYLSNTNGDLPLMATLIGDDLNSVWWSAERFADSRAAFQQQSLSKHSPLKFEIAKYINSLEPIVADGYKEELNLLKKANIDGVITTNWDSLLESVIFDDYKVYVGQDELIFSEEISIGQIFKIHGSVTNPNSLILNSLDYEDFNARYPYLAAKLLTIFVEQPIIFIGYSLDDHNIQDILKSIILCLTKDKVEKLKDRLIICKWDPNTVQPSIVDSTMLITGSVLPIKLITISDFNSLFEVLANNKRRLPVKVLRHMKEMVYDFVKTSNPKNKVIVTDNLDEFEEGKVEFVYGVGLKDKLSEHGIKGIDLRDLLKDCLVHNDWHPSKICRISLPAQTAKYIPYFKYLRSAGYLDGHGNIPIDSPVKEFKPDFISKVNSINQQSFFPPESYCRKQAEINAIYNSIDELIEKEDLYHVCIYAPLLDINKISTLSLKEYLGLHLDEIRNNTHLRKLICYFDYLKNKLEL